MRVCSPSLQPISRITGFGLPRSSRSVSASNSPATSGGSINSLRRRRNTVCSVCHSSEPARRPPSLLIEQDHRYSCSLAVFVQSSLHKHAPCSRTIQWLDCIAAALSLAWVRRNVLRRLLPGDFSKYCTSHQSGAARIVEVIQTTDQFACGIQARNWCVFGVEYV